MHYSWIEVVAVVIYYHLNALDDVDAYEEAYATDDDADDPFRILRPSLVEIAYAVEDGHVVEVVQVMGPYCAFLRNAAVVNGEDVVASDLMMAGAFL